MEVQVGVAAKEPKAPPGPCFQPNLPSESVVCMDGGSVHVWGEELII